MGPRPGLGKVTRAWPLEAPCGAQCCWWGPDAILIPDVWACLPSLEAFRVPFLHLVFCSHTMVPVDWVFLCSSCCMLVGPSRLLFMSFSYGELSCIFSVIVSSSLCSLHVLSLSFFLVNKIRFRAVLCVWRNKGKVQRALPLYSLNPSRFLCYLHVALVCYICYHWWANIDTLLLMRAYSSH